MKKLGLSLSTKMDEEVPRIQDKLQSKFQRVTIEFTEYSSPLVNNVTKIKKTLDLISPVLINMHMLATHAPEVLEKIPKKAIGQLLKNNPVLCRVELRPPKNNLPALYEVMVNSQLGVIGFLRNSGGGDWIEVNQRELMGVEEDGFIFLLKIVEGTSVKLRIKEKISSFGRNSNEDIFVKENGIIVPEVNKRKRKKKKTPNNNGISFEKFISRKRPKIQLNGSKSKEMSFKLSKEEFFTNNSPLPKSNDMLKALKSALAKHQTSTKKPQNLIEIDPENSKKNSITLIRAKNHKDTGSSTCCICYTEDFVKIAGVLACQHKFCYSCIVNWSKVCNTCPLCKHPFTKIAREEKGKVIDYTFIKERREGLNEPLRSVDDTEEWCYKCNSTTRSEVLLVCDSCNFKCCHTFCLEPPISYIPQGEWFCEICVNKGGVLNKLEKPESVVFPEYYQKVEGYEEEEEIKKKRGRKKGISTNPIEGLSDKQKEDDDKRQWSRKERAEKRRKMIFPEKGDLSRRRRFRVRESKRKRRKITTKRVEEKENNSLSEERRRSKRSSIRKCIEKIQRGVNQLNERGNKIDRKKKVSQDVVDNNSITLF